MNLSNIPFKDYPRAEKIFQSLCHPIFSHETDQKVNDRFLDLLQKSVDPDMALNNIERFFNAYMNRSALYTVLDQIPDTLDILVKLSGESQFLSDVLVRNPQYLDWLLEEGDLNCKKETGDYLQEIHEWINPVKSFHRKMNIARRFHRRELLRIGMRDILQFADILDMGEELADLATALVQIAVESCLPGLEKEMGKPQTGLSPNTSHSQFSVIGMGKLGGRELNFSSDIDVLFVYDNEGETTGGFSNHEFFAKLGEGIIQFLSEPTEEGKTYRIDLRLRPEGSAGPLVRSLERYELYYQGFAETWERIALIKSRAVAGDPELGSRFQELIIPFVYRRYLDFSSIAEIRNLKSRMQKEIEKKPLFGLEIKSGTGGIREIEFYAALMQLLHGGKYPELRIQNTVKTLQRLIQNQLIPPKEGQVLIQVYKFLRRVEQKLQLMHQLQTYLIPDDIELRQKIARQLGFQTEIEFSKTIQDDTGKVNEIFHSAFEEGRVTGLKETEIKINRLLDKSIDPETAMRELSSYGFQNIEECRQILHRLAYGDQEHLISPDERRRFLRILSHLLNDLKNLPSPDLGLRKFSRFVQKYGMARTFYSWLGDNPEVFKRLSLCLASSDYLGDLLIQFPDRLDSILTRLETNKLESLLNEPVFENHGQEIKIEEIKRYWEDRKLVIGLVDLINPSGHLDHSKKLSRQADQFIREILEKVTTELNFGDTDQLGFSILGLGKLGGEELTIGSDLDMVFVYADEDSVSSNKSFRHIKPMDFDRVCRLVEELIGQLKSVFGEIDIRLRPEGNKGALALVPGLFEEYFVKRASFWERLAWMKSRFIAGDPVLAEKVLDSAEKFVYGKKVSSKTAKDLWSMRLKMENAVKKEKGKERDIKTGIGGLVDLEFAIQYLCLDYGFDDKSIRGNNIFDILEKLSGQKHIKKEHYEILRKNYLSLSFLQNRLRLMSNYSNNLIPNDPVELTVLSRSMDYQKPEELLDRYQKVSAQNRKILLNILQLK